MGILDRLKRGKRTSKEECSGIVSNAKKSRPTENQVRSMSLIFGSYLGEVMLKNGLSERGYRWGMQNTGNIPLLMADDEKYVTPIDKIYKRLVNGAEDNVVSFYQMMMEEG